MGGAMKFDRRLQRNLGRALVLVAFALILLDSWVQEASGAGLVLLGLPLEAVGAIVLGVGAWLWLIRSRRPER
jgi:hypothetical protein